MLSIADHSRRHPLGAFLLLVYGFSAVLFAVPLLSTDGIGLIDISVGGAMPVVLLATLAIAGAAARVSWWNGGRAAVVDLRGRTFRIRVPWRWYPTAFLISPGVALGVAVIGQGRTSLERLGANPSILLLAVALGAAAFLVIHWWEEVGWTGFVVERLQPSIGPLAASVVTTWLQATVHLPLLFIADGVTDGRLAGGDIPIYLVALYVLPIPLRVLMTWVYNASGRSIPIAGLFHAGFGVATGTDFIPAVAPDFELLWIYGGFAVAALVVIVSTRGQLEYRRLEPSPAVSSLVPQL